MIEVAPGPHKKLGNQHGSHHLHGRIRLGTAIKLSDTKLNLAPVARSILVALAIRVAPADLGYECPACSPPAGLA